MERVFNQGGKPVSIIKVYVKNKNNCTSNAGSIAGYSIDVECFDVFLTDFTKKHLENLCAIVLNAASEIQIYRFIKDRNPIIEFSAKQIAKGNYKVTVATAFIECIKNTKNFNTTINLISKSIIERIIHLFTAYSVDSY